MVFFSGIIAMSRN